MKQDPNLFLLNILITLLSIIGLLCNSRYFNLKLFSKEGGPLLHPTATGVSGTERLKASSVPFSRSHTFLLNNLPSTEALEVGKITTRDFQDKRVGSKPSPGDI